MACYGDSFTFIHLIRSSERSTPGPDDVQEGTFLALQGLGTLGRPARSQ
jgi:hypothetical protein